MGNYLPAAKAIEWRLIDRGMYVLQVVSVSSGPRALQSRRNLLDIQLRREENREERIGPEFVERPQKNVKEELFRLRHFG